MCFQLQQNCWIPDQLAYFELNKHRCWNVDAAKNQAWDFCFLQERESFNRELFPSFTHVIFFLYLHHCLDLSFHKMLLYEIPFIWLISSFFNHPLNTQPSVISWSFNSTLFLILLFSWQEVKMIKFKGIVCKKYTSSLSCRELREKINHEHYISCVHSIPVKIKMRYFKGCNMLDSSWLVTCHLVSDEN